MFKSYDDLINRAGTEERLADLLNIQTYTVQRWRKYGIPQKNWAALIRHYDITPAELFSLNEKIRKDRYAQAKR